MKIAGIGTDLVSIPRMQAMLDRHGNRIARRILGEDEFREFQHSSQPAAYLAKRFAAKEATAKALGTGFRQGLSLRHIQVRNDALGKPELCLFHQAQILAEQLNIGQQLISLSDERHYALAFVTLVERES